MITHLKNVVHHDKQVLMASISHKKTSKNGHGDTLVSLA